MWTHETISPQKSHSRDRHESSNTAETLKNQQNMKTHTHSWSAVVLMDALTLQLSVCCVFVTPDISFIPLSLFIARLSQTILEQHLLFFVFFLISSVCFIWSFFFAFRKCHWRPSRHMQSKNTTGPSLSDFTPHMKHITVQKQETDDCSVSTTASLCFIYKCWCEAAPRLCFALRKASIIEIKPERHFSLVSLSNHKCCSLNEDLLCVSDWIKALCSLTHEQLRATQSTVNSIWITFTCVCEFSSMLT